jgi:dephospho-CoA kinase
LLIGLCGKPQSGKSEVRFILEKQFGFETVNVKLPIIRACHELTGVPFEQFTTQEGKASLYKGEPLRNLMGKVGAVMEKLFGDYHTIERALEEHNITNGKYVVDSLRMTQPSHFIGKVVEVVSNRSIDTGNDFDFYDCEFPDYRLMNNGTLGELEAQIAKMLDYFNA